MTPSVLIGLIWLASPALPVGGFSYSEGLEAAIDAGEVHDEATAARWLDDQLELVLGRAELPLVAAAMSAWAGEGDPRPLHDWVLHTRESAELRQQTLQMGRSLAAWLRLHHPQEARVVALQALPPGPTWPVAFALAGVLAGAPRRELLAAFAFGWAENLVQAAVKAIPLGQSAGQRLLATLAARIPAVVEAALAREAAVAFAPGLAIHSARHEVQYSRLFRS